MDAHVNPHDTGAPAPESTSPPVAPQRAGWRKPLLLVISGALVGALVLVLLAPTIATSRLVLARIESYLTERIGRSVVIGDVDFGWFTEFRLDAVSIPSLPSEGAAGPMLAFGKVHAPVTLLQVLRGAPFDVGLLSIGSLDANIVRFDDGRTNMQIALAGFEASSPPSEGGNSSENGAPAPLPIRILKARATSANIRFHDQPSGLVAGVDGAALDVDWKGPGQSAIVSVVGTGRVNEAPVPVDLVVAIAEFADAAAIPTPDAADVTFRLLIDGKEPPLAEGGVQQKVGDTTMAVRIDADVARLAALASASAPGSNVLRATGRLRGDVRVGGLGGDRTTFAMTLNSQSVAIPGAGGQSAQVPDMSAQATAIIRVYEQTVEQGSVNASISGLTLTGTVASLPFTGPVRDTAISLKLDASLEEFSLSAMKAAGMSADRAPATGDLTIFAGTTGGVEEGAPTELQMRAVWKGGELRTLAPFADDPPALTATTFDLSPSSFELDGLVTFDPEARTIQTEGLHLRSSLANGSVTLNGAMPQGARPEGVVVANFMLDLAKLKVALGPFAPPTLGTLAGHAGTRFQLRAAESRPLAIDLGADVPDLTLSIGEPHMSIFRQEPVSFDSVVKLGSGDAALLVESAGLRSPMGNITAAGKLVDGEGAVIDAEWSLDLARLYAVVNAAKPISGVRGLSGRGSGTIAARYTRPAEPTILLVGTLEKGSAVLDSQDLVPLPTAFTFDVTPTLDRVAGPSVRIDRAEVEWPHVARVTAKGSVASEGETLPVMIDGTLDVDHAGLLSAIPSQARAKLPRGFAADGTSASTFAVRGDASPTNAVPGSLQIQLKTQAAIDSMAVSLESGPLHLTRQSIKASVDADLAPAEPEKARFVATWEHTADRATGPQQLDIAKLQTAVHVEGATLDRVNMMPGFSFETLGVDLTEGRLTLPAVRASLDLRTENHFTKFRMEPSRIALGTLLSWSGSGAFDRGTGEWSLKGDGRVSDLSSASRLVTRTAGLPAPPELWGSIGLSHDLSGIPNPGDLVARKQMPWRGSVTVRGESLAGDFHDGRTFGGGKGSVSITCDPARLGAAVDLTFATLRTAPEPAKPMADVVIGFGAETADLDRLEVTRLAVTAGNMKTALDATGTIDGLHATIVRVLEDTRAARPVTLPDGINGWLSAITMESRGSATLETTAFSDSANGLSLSGPLAIKWSAVSRPASTVALDLDCTTAGLNAASAGSWKVRDTSGTLGLAKSWTLGRAGFRAPDPEFQTSGIRSLEFDTDKASIRIRDLALRTRAADNGIVVEARTPFMNGGPVAFDGTITLVGGEPVLEGSLQSTRLDLRTLLPPPARNSPVPLELDAVTRIRWNLGRTVETANVFEGLELNATIPRIDLATILAILRVAQPMLGAASMVSTEAALRTGMPTDGRMTLRNGLFSFGFRLQPFISPVAFELTPINNISVSNAAKTSDFSEMIERISMMRTSLRVLLAESFADATRASEAPRGTGR